MKQEVGVGSRGLGGIHVDKGKEHFRINGGVAMPGWVVW